MARRKKHQRSRARNSGDVIVTHGKTILTAPNAASSSGTTQVTRYEIDTNLCTVWAQYSAIYNKWKIHWLKFTFVPRVVTTTFGQIAMCVQEDPDAQVITTFDAMMNNRVATMGVAYSRRTLTYKPIGTGWLYTQDNALSVDRTEMPGDFNFASGSFTAALAPGDIILEYRISFTGSTNSGAFKADRLVKKLLPALTREQLAEIQDEVQSSLEIQSPPEHLVCSHEDCRCRTVTDRPPAKPDSFPIGAERQLDPFKATLRALIDAANMLLIQSNDQSKLAAPD